MCLKVKSTITNSKYLDLSQPGISLRVNFSCGNCSECRQLKSNDYMARSSAQWRYTVNNGGFAFFDTLTYNQDNVPVYSPLNGLMRGISNYDVHSILTFNPEDYRLFLKRLRINLTRAGYVINHRDDNNKLVSDLKYFFVSEYGGHTHRPHYHVIFYCTVPGLTPDDLNKYIYQSWSLGITDLSKSASEKTVNGNGILHYVAKYVNKDLDYMSILDKYCVSNDVPDFDKKHILMPFHRQSQGFGLDMINQQDYDLMFNENKIKVNDSDGYHFQRIPLYIKRKLWYNLVKWSDETLHWVLNEEGIRQHQHSIQNQIVDTSDRLLTNFQNANSILHTPIFEHVNSILGNRSITELARYIVLFRGKNFVPDINFELDDNFDSVNNFTYGIDYSLVDEHSLIFKPVDKGFKNSLGVFLSNDTLLRYHAISQDSYYGFEHFDYLVAVNDLIQDTLNKPVDDNFFRIEQIRSRLKIIKDRYL